MSEITQVNIKRIYVITVFVKFIYSSHKCNNIWLSEDKRFEPVSQSQDPRSDQFLGTAWPSKGEEQIRWFSLGSPGHLVSLKCSVDHFPEHYWYFQVDDHYLSPVSFDPNITNGLCKSYTHLVD